MGQSLGLKEEHSFAQVAVVVSEEALQEVFVTLHSCGRLDAMSEHQGKNNRMTSTAAFKYLRFKFKENLNDQVVSNIVLRCLLMENIFALLHKFTFPPI